MDAKIVKGNLVITIPVNKVPARSKSGKSFVVATTSGNVATDLEFDGQIMKLGVNAFYPAPQIAE